MAAFKLLKLPHKLARLCQRIGATSRANPIEFDHIKATFPEF